MSQHDLNIANQTFPSFRSDLNSALEALGTLSSGATAPSPSFANQLWVDTAADPILLKIRNNDNDAWITIGSITATTDLFTLVADTISEATSAAGVTIDGVLLKDSAVSTDTISEKTGGSGVTVDGVLLKDSTVTGGLDTGVTAAGLTVTGTTIAADGTDTNISVTVTPKGTGVVTTASSYSDGAGKLRAIPQSGSAKTTGYTLATTDVGEFIEVGSGGSITIPDATFSAGDVVSIFNNTTGDVTITCSITTAYIAGTDTDESSVTLATRGICTVLFISGTVCVISGNV